jgi:hypothetical protein
MIPKCLARAAAVALFPLALAAQAPSSQAGTGVAEGVAADPSEISFDLKLKPGFGFGMDFLKLFNGVVEPAASLYGVYLGDCLSALTLKAYGQYGSGTWLRREDGSLIDPYGPDAGRAAWKQLTGRLTLSASQGLIANPDPDKQGQDLLSLSLAYAASYYRKL